MLLNIKHIFLKCRLYTSGISFNKIIFNISIFLKIFYFYLAFVGIFGFALFIGEEAAQVIMWGSFAAQSAHRYDLLKSNCEAIEKISTTSRWINDKFMWINPFQYWSYGAFLDGNQAYVISIKALIFANEPSLYINQEISMYFKYESFSAAQNGLFVAENNLTKVILAYEPKINPVHITGVVTADPDKIKGIIIRDQEKK